MIWSALLKTVALIFGILAYRQFSLGKSFASLSIILLVAVMVLNGLGNFVIFKYRSIKWFYLVIYPFALILLTLIVILWKDDMVSLQFGRAALLPKGEAIIPPEPSCSLKADSFDPLKVLTLLNTFAITENNSKIN